MDGLIIDHVFYVQIKNILDTVLTFWVKMYFHGLHLPHFLKKNTTSDSTGRPRIYFKTLQTLAMGKFNQILNIFTPK